jgi:hypothetical protein
LLNGKGTTFAATIMDFNEYGGVDSYISKMNGVKDYSYIVYGSAYYGEAYENSIDVIGYDKYAGGYVPKLTEGRWYTDCKEEGVIPVVVVANKYNFSVGDTVSLKDYNSTSYSFYICGIMTNGEYCYDVYNTTENESVYEFFNAYDSTVMDEIDCIFVTDKAYIEQYEAFSTPSQKIMVSYNDDITDEEISENVNYLKHHGAVYQWSNEEILNNTKAAILKKILVILPLTIGTMILMTLSLATVTMIDVTTSLKSYAIFYICGMKWSKSLVISFFRMILISVLGLAFMEIFYNLTILTNIGSYLQFSHGLAQWIGCLMVFIYILLVSLGISVFELRKKQPYAVLRSV